MGLFLDLVDWIGSTVGIFFAYLFLIVLPLFAAIALAIYSVIQVCNNPGIGEFSTLAISLAFLLGCLCGLRRAK
jgi:hypothetical protein